MCQIMEDYAEKRTNNVRIQFAKNLWNSGMRDFQQIADLTDLPLDEVKKLFEDKTA